MSETCEEVCEVLLLSLFSNLVFVSTNMSKDKNISSEVSREVDLKLHMEAMMGEVRRMLRVELEQVHEQMDRMKTSRVEQPQSSNWRRIERVPPREEIVEEEEHDGDGLDEEDER